jgi:hypothetical protein
MIIPLNVVHELGHAFVCAGYNQEYSISLSLLDRSNVMCSGDNLNITVYGVVGGLSVMIVSLSVLLIPQVRNNTGMRIGFVSIAAMSFVNAMLEGFFIEVYNNNLLISEVSLLMVLLLVYVKQWMSTIRNK